MTSHSEAKTPENIHFFRDASADFVENTAPRAGKVCGKGETLRSRSSPLASGPNVFKNLLLITVVSFTAAYLVLACFRLVSFGFRGGNAPRAVAAGGLDAESCPTSENIVVKNEGSSSAAASGHADEPESLEGGQPRRSQQRKRARRKRSSRVEKEKLLESEGDISAEGGIGGIPFSIASAVVVQDPLEPADAPLPAPSPAHHDATLLPRASTPSKLGRPSKRPLGSAEQIQPAGFRRGASQRVLQEQPSTSRERKPERNIVGWGFRQMPARWEQLFRAALGTIHDAAATCAVLIPVLDPEIAVTLTCHLAMMATVELSALANIPDELQPLRAEACSAYINLLRELLAENSRTSVAAEELGLTTKINAFQRLLEQIAGIPPPRESGSVEAHVFKTITQMRLTRFAFGKASNVMYGLIPQMIQDGVPAQRPRNVVEAFAAMAQLLRRRLLGNSTLRHWLFECEQRASTSLVFDSQAYLWFRYPMAKFQEALDSIDAALDKAGCSLVPIYTHSESGLPLMPTGERSSESPPISQHHDLGLARDQTASPQRYLSTSIPSASFFFDVQPSAGSGRPPEGPHDIWHPSLVAPPPGLQSPSSQDARGRNSSHLARRELSLLGQPSPRPFRTGVFARPPGVQQQYDTTREQPRSSVVMALSSPGVKRPPPQPFQASPFEVAARSDESGPSELTHSEISQSPHTTPSTDLPVSLRLLNQSSIWTPSEEEKLQLLLRSQPIPVPRHSTPSEPAFSVLLPEESSSGEWTPRDQGEDQQRDFSGPSALQSRYMRKRMEGVVDVVQ
ncbi:hypothetical protein Efla_006085 [Eimeria flavescens]